MHSNLESRSVQQKNLRRVLLLTGVFMVVEVIAGLFTGSLALLADAGHMLTDVAALSLSAFALWMAGKPSTPENTYGYHRAEILAAVVNAVVLLLLATWILYEAYDRFGEPSAPGLGEIQGESTYSFGEERIEGYTGQRARRISWLYS